MNKEQNTMKELLADPRFENLLAKAEAHQWQFRPRESERLQAAGKLLPLLEERTRNCWELLRTLRRAGLTLTEAQELAYPEILVPGEAEHPGFGR